MPTANAQNDQLAAWLSRVFGPISTIHQVEGGLLDALGGQEPDVAKLKVVCPQLNDGKSAVQAQLPSPDPKLTAEVQQAVDNFETAAMENCDAVVGWRPDPNKNAGENEADRENLVNELWGSLGAAEKHLVSADTVLAGLTAKSQP